MTWKKSDPKEQKILFIADWLKEEWSMTELCDYYSISRKTGYKLVNRYVSEKEAAFEEKSRAKHFISNKVSSVIVNKLVQLKHEYPTFGPMKLRNWLIKNKPEIKWPATSTISEVLKSHGLVKPRKYRHKIPPYTQPFSDCSHVNKTWSADFKGKFRLGNTRYCHPLTVTDNYSRFLLGCDGMYQPTLKETKRVFERIFYQYGLPEVIRTDNGTPFAGTGIGGLSQLSIWWIKLGIIPERIDAGCPEQNGRHERMHRTLKEATTKPPKRNLSNQQQCFNDFIHEYNHERSHEGIENKCPGEIYQSSNRSLPSRIPEICYPSHFEIRKVRSNGEIKLNGKRYYLTELLHGEYVGIEMLDGEQAIIHFAKLKLGKINAEGNRVIRL
jgi:putative transposase